MTKLAIPKNALTVDVEDYFQVAALAEAFDPADWDSVAPRVVENTERLIDLFAEFETRATFFTLGWVAERFPRLIRKIADAGHEVACHGMNHQLIYNQDPTVFAAETKQAKDLLEQAGGQAVIGYRAASYSITNKSLWALDVLVDNGFVYDSSIFPVTHDFYGIAGAPRFIHERETPNGQSITEFPPTTARVLGKNLPASGGGYFRLYPYWLSRRLLRSVQAENKPFVFYLHPWEVDPQQPRVDEVGWKSRFRHYNNLEKCLPRLRRLLADFEFTTMHDVIANVSERQSGQQALGEAV